MVIYRTPDELEDRARQRETEAAGLPPGPALLSILKEARQLRIYADMKRLLDIPKPTAK